jgi:hypothetical protein
LVSEVQVGVQLVDGEGAERVCRVAALERDPLAQWLIVKCLPYKGGWAEKGNKGWKGGKRRENMTTKEGTPEERRQGGCKA